MNKNNNVCQEEELCKYAAIGCDKVSEALSLIDGKWKLKLLYLIGYNEIIRYGELKRQASPITHKMLASELKALEKDGLIIRKDYEEVPPKVEYTLSQKGYDLLPMFDALFDWMVKYML